MYNEFNTKNDYIQALKSITDPLNGHYSEGNARLKVGSTGTFYGKSGVEAEAFLRVLWGLTPLWSGTDSRDFLDTYINGVINGTSPNNAEYWGNCKDNDSLFVEMTTLGLSLLMTPDLIWNALSENQKLNLNNWLLQINNHKFSENNWLFFQVIVNSGLKKVNGIFDQKAIDNALEKIDSFYLGDGWYSDGKTDQRDYYVAFALHFYSLIYAKTMQDFDPERCKVFKERSALFAKSYIYWFSDSGESIPFGRSLTYRFAQCCFWSSLVFADVEAFSWGVIKGILSRNFHSWFSKEMFDNGGILTIGYAYPNLNMAEGYNGPGSPYWALKSFLILAVPDDHAFWAAKIEPLPELDEVKQLIFPRMVMQRCSKDNIVALTSGQYTTWKPVHYAEKFEKFAYSTAFGFSVPRSYDTLDHSAPDNMLAFNYQNMIFVRRKCDSINISNNIITSIWSPFDGVTVETEIRPFGKGHFRRHKIHSELSCQAMECGFTMPEVESDDCSFMSKENFASITSAFGKSSIEVKIGNGTGKTILCEANTNLLHPRTFMPYIQLEVVPGDQTIEVFVEGTTKSTAEI